MVVNCWWVRLGAIAPTVICGLDHSDAEPGEDPDMQLAAPRGPTLSSGFPLWVTLSMLSGKPAVHASIRKVLLISFLQPVSLAASSVTQTWLVPCCASRWCFCVLTGTLPDLLPPTASETLSAGLYPVSWERGDTNHCLVYSEKPVHRLSLPCPPSPLLKLIWEISGR